MYRIALAGFLAALVLTVIAGPAAATSFEDAMNAAGVIDYPTAFDQTTDHAIQGTLEIYNLSIPDLRPQDVRYGYQYGDFNLLVDAHLDTVNRRWDFGEVRTKLRIVNLDEFRTYGALGLMGRSAVSQAAEGEPAPTEHRPISLLGVVSVELFPFDPARGLLVNFYLDNEIASLGLKTEVYQNILVLGEADMRHYPAEQKQFGAKLGVESQGEQNFFFQLYFSFSSRHFLAQIGTGF